MKSILFALFTLWSAVAYCQQPSVPQSGTSTPQPSMPQSATGALPSGMPQSNTGSLQSSVPQSATSAPQSVTQSASTQQPTAPPPLAKLQLPLIKNGNMEQKSGQSWFFGYNGPQNSNPNEYVFEQSVEASASGEYSLKIKCKLVKSDSVFCNLNQNFSTAGIPVGAKLILKAKIKLVGVQGRGISLVLRGEKNINGKNIGSFFISTEGKLAIVGTHEFEEYSLVLDSYPGNADKITMLMIYLPGTIGTVYLDDVSVSVN